MNYRNSAHKIIDSGIAAPIIFSVTGHIDIPQDEIESIRNRIGSIFDDFISWYPHTDLILMTALAEGADRIAAMAARERGIKVAPVLPKTPSIYEQTFSNEDSKDEFYRILSEDNTLSPCIISTDDNCERESFRALSAYLISNSHIMIAVWDGRTYNREGGTYDTVRMGFMGIDPDLKTIAHPMSPVSDNLVSVSNNYLSVTEDCLLYIIQTDRSIPEDLLIKRGCILEYGKLSNGACGYLIPKVAYSDAVAFESKKRSFSSRFFKSEHNHHDYKCIELKMADRIIIGAPINGLPPGHSLDEYDESVCSRMVIPEYYRRIFDKIDELNSDMGVVSDTHEYAKDSVANSIISCKYENGTLWKTRFSLLKASDAAYCITSAGCMDEMAMRYQVADSLAMNNQKKSFRIMLYLIVMNILSGLFFQIYILIGGGIFVVFVYVVLMLCSNMIYGLYEKGSTYSKFIEYRTLAESMRVNYYWGLSSINDTASSSCYGFMKNELSWTRAVIKSWSSYFLNDYSKSSNVAWDDREECIIDSWINGQIKYHSIKLEHNKKAYWLNNLANKITLALLSLFSALVILLNLYASNWMNGIMVVFEPISINGLILISGLNVTALMIFKLIMIALSTAFACTSTLRNRIHGGTPNQIMAKLSMFDLASMRLNQTTSMIDRNMAQSVSAEVLVELGNQCTTEVNDWAFEIKTKNIEPTRGRITPTNLNSD